MKEWIEGLTHEGLTTPEAVQALDKYESAEEALFGGYNAMKATGKPYKLPESLDKLPDDNTRTEFRNQVSTIMGGIARPEDMEGIDFATGLADASTIDDNIKSKFTEFCVQHKVPRGLAQEIIGMYNGLVQGALNDHSATRKATADSVHASLSELFGGDEGVKNRTLDVHKLFQNHGGLTAEEYENSVKGLIDSGVTQNAAMCKALFNIASKMTSEGSTTQAAAAGGQTGAAKTEEQSLKEELPKTAVALGW